jgi:hypothetical protein
MDFEYLTEGGLHIRYYPFRVGDLVFIKSFGSSYGSYTEAFNKLIGKSTPPFYSRWINYCKVKKNRIFKIVSVCEHQDTDDILFYVKDNENKGCVISGRGLKPFKTYPLRPGETNFVKVERIKI